MELFLDQVNLPWPGYFESEEIDPFNKALAKPEDKQAFADLWRASKDCEPWVEK